MRDDNDGREGVNTYVDNIRWCRVCVRDNCSLRTLQCTPTDVFIIFHGRERRMFFDSCVYNTRCTQPVCVFFIRFTVQMQMPCKNLYTYTYYMLCTHAHIYEYIWNENT